MSIAVTEITSLNEKEFLLLDDNEPDDKGFINGVRIHPWDRSRRFGPNDRSVYVSVGWFGKDGEIGRDDEGNDEYDEYQSVIVNRDDFVEAILAVFPELKRA